VSHPLDDPNVSVRDMVTEGIQDALNLDVGPPDSCERPTGHSGRCGWFISAAENGDAIIGGRCGAEPERFVGVIRA